jgi:molybdopterin converting factor small subunit
MGSITLRYRTSKGVQETAINLRAEATLRDLVARLAGEAGGELEAVSKQVLKDSHADLIVVLNGAVVQSPDGMDMPIGDGDTVSILPLVVGG